MKKIQVPGSLVGVVFDVLDNKRMAIVSFYTVSSISTPLLYYSAIIIIIVIIILFYRWRYV